MMTLKHMPVAGNNDADLVAACLDGNREVDGNRNAFGQIVSRYQSLICSLAYSATGCLAQSQDLAQETFITAWKHLSLLRERDKLRAWLCGIARNRINISLRREGREPLRDAESLDLVHDIPTLEPLPSDHAISKEEEAILWRSLERIPETYREPLILFYREHQSIERVAEELELSEDAVKQRLSRGRKLLHEEVLAFVEGALERTNPGKAFTLGVIAALPVFATSASAATIGAAAAKGSVMTKASAVLSMPGVILGPLVSILSAWVDFKASLYSAQSAREREFLIRSRKANLALTIAFCLALAALFFLTSLYGKSHPVLTASGWIALCLGLAAGILTLSVWSNRQVREIRAQETTAGRAIPPEQQRFLEAFEYRSKQSFLGFPLLHIHLRGAAGKKPRVAKGWIALGDIAVGAVACGAVAVGGICVGGAAIGLLAIGGAALGVLTVAGLGIGGFAIGGCAIGYFAIGGVAVAWLAAQGNVAVARQFADGGVAFAPNANDAVAHAFMQGNVFFSHAQLIISCVSLLLFLQTLIVWQTFRTKKILLRGRIGGSA